MLLFLLYSSLQFIEKEPFDFDVNVSQYKKDEFKERVHKYVDIVVAQTKVHFPHVQQIAHLVSLILHDF